MGKNTRNGLLALLGMGALAFWKYKNMSPDEKQGVKDQFENAKKNISNAGRDIQDTINDKLHHAKSEAKDSYAKAKDSAQDTYRDVKDDVNKNFS